MNQDLRDIFVIIGSGAVVILLAVTVLGLALLVLGVRPM